MTIDRPLTEARPQVPADVPPSVHPSPSALAGERLRRLRQRRRLVREELLAVAVLLALLAVTVVVLATKWLESGPSATSLLIHALTSGGTT